MKKLFILLFVFSYVSADQLVDSRFHKLDLGSVQPSGWLETQLKIQANGLTGHLADFWPDLINSQWIGKEGGDSWERTPYYLDGLVPLAYILDDSLLKEKAQVYIEGILSNQRDDGWFGPGQHWETWPQAIANKVLTSYYEATGDERALKHIQNYFEYLYNAKPDYPDDDWRGVRAMEHAVTGYWLYKKTGDEKILQTIQKIFENSSDWTTFYEKFPWDEQAVLDGKIPHNWGADGLTAHVVNNAMAIKYPGIYYQQSGDERFKNAVFDGLEKYDAEHGQVGGRFSGDEHLSGTHPSQGTEMCSVVELMFSLEQLLKVFDDTKLADRLELLAYNSLPATMTADGWAHQYDQQTNQVLCTIDKRNWSTNGDYSNIYGLMPNYPCCLANMHQGWPKFVEHMWYATNDGGLAAVTFGPNKVKTTVGKNVNVEINQITNYPFSDTLKFEVTTEKKTQFPLYLRKPGWINSCTVLVNGKKAKHKLDNGFIKLKQKWQTGDTIELILPARLETEKRYNDAVAVRRGPLYFALQIDKAYKAVTYKEEQFGSISYIGSRDWEIRPTSAWNYGLAIDTKNIAKNCEIDYFQIHEFPFADRGDMVYWEPFDNHVSWQHETPIVITLPAKKIPSWKIKDNSADTPPASPVMADTETDSVQLVPYGCTRLRIAEFPVIGTNQ